MRRWLLAGTVLVLALTGLGVGLAWREAAPACGASVRSLDAGDSVSPFAPVDAADTPGADTPDSGPAAPEPLVTALGRAGEVLGSRGYDHDQEVQLSGYAVGLGVRLRDSDRFTMLGRDLAPIWSVAVGTRSSAFDADDETYVVVTLPEDAAPEVVSLDLATGERRWCTTLGTEPASGVATQLLDDGSVVALLDGEGTPRLVRVDPDGQRWSSVPGGGGDHLAQLDAGRLLVGGSALPELLDGPALAAQDAGQRLAAVDVDRGRTSWTLEEPAGSDVHVVGVTGDRVVLTRAVAGQSQPRLVGLDAEGREVWGVTPAVGTAFDATVREDRVVVRAGRRWTAYDARTGERLWRFTVPRTPQFLPYGAVLDAAASPDPGTLLLGATDALVRLDLRTGRREATPLPTDGLATTYWPYQVVTAPGLLAVATSTGTVVVRR